MSLVACPNCSLPRSETDAAFECPVCGYHPCEPDDDGPDEPVLIDEEDDLPVSLTPVPVIVPPTLPVRVPHRATLPWSLAALGLVGTLICAVGWYRAAKGPSATEATAKPGTREVAPTPRRLPDPLELAPDPHAYVEPVRPFEVIRVDNPVTSYKLPIIDGKRRVKLVGAANKLLLAAIVDGAEVDATELETRGVTATGRIHSGATVRVKSPGGFVTFSEDVGGGATVVVDAPDGNVTFGKRGVPKAKAAAQPGISGGATVTVVGRQVTFLSPISDAGTAVDVTLSSRGHLKFSELDGGARLSYRASRPTDPPLIVNPGRVKGDAEFKQVK